MRALVVAPQPFFSPRGTPLSVYYRTLTTCELGVQVDLLTYGEGQDAAIDGLTIYRVPRFGFLGPVKVGPSMLKLWLDGFIILWTLSLLVRKKYDFVHAHEESVFFLRFLKPIFRFKLVYDMHSSLPQQLRNFDYTKSKLLIGLFEALENTCLANADAVITICPELQDYATPRMPDPTRHFLIENSIFAKVRLKGAETEVPLPELGPLPADRGIVAYAGTFESYQGIEILLEAFAEVRRRGVDAHLLMIGGSPEQVRHYRSMAKKFGAADDVSFTGRVPQAQVKPLLQRADVLMSPRKEGTNTPLKIYEQIASGIPLVATRILSHTQVLDDEVCFLCDPNASSMADAIVSALTDDERRKRIVDNARALYESRYSRRAYMQKMRSLLERLH